MERYFLFAVGMAVAFGVGGTLVEADGQRMEFLGGVGKELLISSEQESLEVADILRVYAKHFAEFPWEEVEESVRYLVDHMPREDMGHVCAFYIAENVYYALKAYHTFSWARTVPRSLFLNEVLPYSSFTEPRDRWRRVFYGFITQPHMGLVNNGTLSSKEVALILNEKIWAIVDPPIVFAAAPANRLNHYGIFEIMKAHNASCTGLAIFLVNALRCAGIPARIAGVPHWNKGSKTCPHGDADAACGNHNWVELWSDGGWHFIDQRGTENRLDQGWFYPQDVNFQVPDTLNHSIFSTSWASTASLKTMGADKYYPGNKPAKYFPMVWDWTDDSVQGWDSTLFYLR